MQAHVFALFGVCLAVSLCELLLPGDAANGSRRMLRMLASLSIIVILLTPIKGLLETYQGGGPAVTLPEGEEEAFAEYEAIFEEAVKQQSRKDLESGIKGLLYAEYGIQEQELEVLIYLSPDGAPERICIYLRGPALTQDPTKIEALLAERLHCTVEVR